MSAVQTAQNLADMIVCGNDKVPGSDLACGMKFCPFHRWATISSPGPIDSICTLPGEGGNVIDCSPFHQPDREVEMREEDGTLHVEHRRLPKCLAVKPLPETAKYA
jgi:hypothetical protein